MSKQTVEREPQCPPFVMRVVEEHDDGVTIEVTEEDYKRDLAAGISEDELLKPGKHRFRRVSAERAARFQDSKPDEFYLEVKLRLDEDVYRFLKKRAAERDVDMFQTLINDELRRVMEREKKEIEDTRREAA